MPPAVFDGRWAPRSSSAGQSRSRKRRGVSRPALPPKLCPSPSRPPSLASRPRPRPDLAPIVGEAPELANYWVCAGLNSIGILTGGGIGKMLATHIVEGRADKDVTGYLPARLQVTATGHLLVTS